MGSFTRFRLFHKAICSLCATFDTEGPQFGKHQGILVLVSSFDWISCANAYVVLVCEHPYDLRHFYPGGCYMCMLWLIFSTSLTCCFKVVFSKTSVLRWSFPFYVWGGGRGGNLGSLFRIISARNVFVYAEKAFSGD